MLYGKDYGIIIKYGWLTSILVNLPLINLLYTKKIMLDVVGFYDKRPASGTFKHFRILVPWLNRKKERVVNFMFALHDSFREVRIYIKDGKNPPVYVGYDIAVFKCEWRDALFRYTFTNGFSPIEERITKDE